MQNIDRVFTRLKKNGQIPAGADPCHYRLITFGKQYTLTTGLDLPGQSQDFPAGAIVLSLGAWATVPGLAATAAVRGDLSMVRIQVAYPSQDGNLIAGQSVNLAALLGFRNERQWPEKEIVISDNGSLTIGLTNLTTTTIAVDLAWNCLVKRSAAA